MRGLVCAALILALTAMPAFAQQDASDGESGVLIQLEQQLDALGRDELMDSVPSEAVDYMREADFYEMDLNKLLQLTPGKFFPALWRMLENTVRKPAAALGAMLAVILICALLEALRTTVADAALSEVFQTVSVLCILTVITAPILDCVAKSAATIRDAAFFMTGFIPMFAAAMVSAGQPVTGAAYNMFLLTACQLVSQVVAQTLIPMMSVYLAFCVCGSFLPGVGVESAAAGIKNAVSWAMGLILTLFVSLLSIQSILSHGADSAGVKATKFLITSLVPAVGSILSEAYMATQGCLRLLKTTVGAYGIVVAVFTFLPTFLHVAVWYFITRVVALSGDIVGADRVSSILRACSNVLGLLMAAILCFAILFIVSTGIVMITGIGG